jgi:hypothetical protein
MRALECGLWNVKVPEPHLANIDQQGRLKQDHNCNTRRKSFNLIPAIPQHQSYLSIILIKVVTHGK